MNNHFLNTPLIYRLGTRWIGSLPLWASYALSQTIANISYFFYRSAVNNVKKNLARVFPHISNRRLCKFTRQLFRNYSKYLVDYGRFTYLDENSILKNVHYFEGIENFESALDLNKGLILLTAHLGNWELGGIFLSNYGLKVNVVTLPDENPHIDSIRTWYRTKFNIKTITVGSTPLSILDCIKALNNKEIVAMLIDRYNSYNDSIEINFFGKPSLFPKGPLILSRLTGAPVVMAFVVREEERYKSIMEKPFVVTTEEQEYIVANEIVKILENYIKLYPEQWYNYVTI